MPDSYEPTYEEVVMFAYRAIPEPVRERMPEAWVPKAAVWWWATGTIDDEYVEQLWKSTEGALRVLRYLEEIQGREV